MTRSTWCARDMQKIKRAISAFMKSNAAEFHPLEVLPKF